MAVEFDGITLPESTGAVPTPTGPVTIKQAVGHPVSSGAVDGPPASVVTGFGPLGTDSTGAVPTPTEPVTSGPFAKVVRPGRRAAAPETTTVAETADSETPARRATSEASTPARPATELFDGR